MQFDHNVYESLLIWAKTITPHPRLEFFYDNKAYRCQVFSSGFNISDQTPLDETKLGIEL